MKPAWPKVRLGGEHRRSRPHISWLFIGGSAFARQAPARHLAVAFALQKRRWVVSRGDSNSYGI